MELNLIRDFSLLYTLVAKSTIFEIMIMPNGNGEV